MDSTNLTPAPSSAFQQAVDQTLSFHERQWVRAMEQMEPSFIESLMDKAAELLVKEVR